MLCVCVCVCLRDRLSIVAAIQTLKTNVRACERAHTQQPLVVCRRHSEMSRAGSRSRCELPMHTQNQQLPFGD